MHSSIRSTGFQLAGMAGVLIVGFAATPSLAAQEKYSSTVREMALAIHPVPPQAVKNLDNSQVAEMRALARDTDFPLFGRARVLGLLGAHVSAEVETLWTEARSWPETELRLQATWAQALAHRHKPDAVKFLGGLLRSEQPRVREVAVHVLASLGTTPARQKLADQLTVEKDRVVRALLQRRQMP